MRIESTTVVMPRDIFEDRLMRSKTNLHKWEDQICEGITIADVLFKTTFLKNWGSGVGRMIDACREANLPEPEFNQNAAFVWVTFKRTTINAYNHTTIQPYNHTSSPHNLKGAS